jgi:hypothetical protein
MRYIQHLTLLSETLLDPILNAVRIAHEIFPNFVVFKDRPIQIYTVLRLVLDVVTVHHVFLCRRCFWQNIWAFHQMRESDYIWHPKIKKARSTRFIII